MNPADIFIFVVASFEEPAYLDFIKMRKLQFKKYGIPNMFLFDGVKPTNFGDENDVFFEKPVPPKDIPNPELNPHMILKFLKAIRTIDINKYKFILRINVSTFINFPNILDFLTRLPDKNIAAAHLIPQKWIESDNNRERKVMLLLGTCMIFTTDFIGWLQLFPLEEKVLNGGNDDMVLTVLARKFGCRCFHIPMFWWETSEVKSEIRKSLLVRLKNEEDRQIDVIKWEYLLKTVDYI